jgi:hypothetical protein
VYGQMQLERQVHAHDFLVELRKPIAALRLCSTCGWMAVRRRMSTWPVLPLSARHRPGTPTVGDSRNCRQARLHQLLPKPSSKYQTMQGCLCMRLTCKQVLEGWQKAQSGTYLVSMRVHERKQAARHQAGCALHDSCPARPALCRQQRVAHHPAAR